MAICRNCGAEVGRFSLIDGLCTPCKKAEVADLPARREAIRAAEAQARREGEELAEAMAEEESRRFAAIASIIVTTETAHNLPVADRLDIVTAEVVLGMNFFKDVAAGFRDVFGGRSKVMQEGLRDARKLALQELRVEAHAIGAQAVVGVSLNYSEISDGGKVMLLLVAAGTAVTLSASNEALA